MADSEMIINPENYRSPNNFASILKELLELRKSRIYCDVIIDCAGREFWTHRSVLMAASPFFCSTLSVRSMGQATMMRLTLPDHFVDIVDELLTFMYTGQMCISESHADRILSVAHHLRMERLSQLVSRHYIRKLSIHHWYDLSRLAKEHACVALSDAVNQFVVDNFCAVRETRAFLEASEDLITVWLQNDALRVEKEEDVLWAVIDWVRFNPSRAESVYDLFQHVRLPLLSHYVIGDRLVNDPIFNDLRMQKLLLDAVLLSNSPQRMVTTSRTSCRPRIHHTWHDVILLVGVSSSKRSFLELCSYVPDRNEHIPLCSLMQPFVDFSVVGTNRQLYVFVVCRDDPYICQPQRYDVVLKCWESLALAPTSAKELAIAAFNDDIYAIGGVDRNCKCVADAWKFSHNSNTWVSIKPLAVPRRGLALAGTGHLYAIGGYTDNAKAVPTVEKYDPLRNCWTTIAPMSEGKAFVSAAAYDRKVYVVGGEKNAAVYSDLVEVLDTSTGSWQFVSRLPSPRTMVGIAVLQERLYVSGGIACVEESGSKPMDETYVHVAELHTMDCHDLAARKWLPTQRLPYMHGKVEAVLMRLAKNTPNVENMFDRQF